MKVLLVTTMFPPYCGGGVSSHVWDLSRSLAREGVDVTVLTSRRGSRKRPDEGEFAPPGVRVEYRASLLRMLLACGRLTRENHYDLVHFHAFVALLLAPLVKSMRAVPVFTLHSDTANYIASVRGWRGRRNPAVITIRVFERIAIRFPAITIAVSYRMEEYARALGAVHVRRIPNAVDTSYWAASPTAPNGHPLLVVPRMHVPKNGIEYAIRAMHFITRSIPRTRLVVTGDGPLRPSLEDLAREVGKKKVRFVGTISRESMRDLYRHASAVFIPSITSAGTQENTSISALEAMACGAPVIATTTGGLTELVRDGMDGFLVPEQDPEALAEAAIRILRDPGLGARLGSEARAHAVSEFSVETWVDKVLQAYEEAETIHTARNGGPR